jgi:hypothetical protein
MASVTLVELHLEEASFSANLPFSGSDSTETDDEEATESEEEAAAGADAESGGPGKGGVLLGVLVFLVVTAAIVRYLTGEDDPDVEIETADDGPVGVTVDTDDE